MNRPPTHINLQEEAYETIASETAKHLPKETGGILLGYQEDSIFVVTHALSIEGQEPTTDRYIRNDFNANILLKGFLKSRTDDDPTGYIGEWHSHPSPSEPSSIDQAAMRAIAKDSPKPLALLTFTPGGRGMFYGLIAQRHAFGRVATKRATVSLPPSRFSTLAPLPPSAVCGVGPVFISYRQSDGALQAMKLESLLRAAGLVVWRDRTDLPPGTTTDRLEQALTSGLSAAILIVTPEIVHSDIVRERELPRLLELDKDSDFCLCIANGVPRAEDETKCDYDAPDRLLRISPARTLANKKQANILKSSGEIEIVRDLLMHRAKQRRTEISTDARAFTIRIQSRQTPSAIDADENDLHIRLQPADSGRLPSRIELESLQKALPLISETVSATTAKRVSISGGAHLSIAIALGAALPETMIGKIAVVDKHDKVWRSSKCDDDPLKTELTINSVEHKRNQTSDKHRVAVFVTLTPQPDMKAFRQLVEDSTEGFDTAQVISVTESKFISPNEGARLSAEIANQIKKVSASQGRAEVHMAFHGPYPMAVLVGRYLNTLQTIVYEWDDSKTTPLYKPVLALAPGYKYGPITQVLMTDQGEINQ